MSDCKDHKNPLQHSGTSQNQRELPALRPGYVDIEEHDYPEWIVFASEFARFLNYYDPTGLSSGNWSVFFKSDISAVLGNIVVQDVDAYRRGIKERFDFLKNSENSGNHSALKITLYELFSAAFTLSLAFDATYRNLSDKIPEEGSDGSPVNKSILLKPVLENLIISRLAPAQERLLTYYTEAKTRFGFLSSEFADLDFSGWKVLGQEVKSAESCLENVNGWSELWWQNSPATDWDSYLTYVNGLPEAGIFGLPTWNVFTAISHAAQHNLFVSVFDQYTQVFKKTVDSAGKQLEQTLSDWNIHPPHYALFLAFLRLYHYLKEHLNTLTHRHLDYYYQEILRLYPKPAEPDHVHLIVELARQMEDYALPEGTLFKAGKDSEGKEVAYGTEKEEAFNKAKVILIKSIYKGSEDDNYSFTVKNVTTEVNNAGRLFASPVANSDDGNGAELTSSSSEWHPFVTRKYEEGKLADIVSPNAEIGFAIASHYLFLGEGEREILVRVALSDAAKLTAFTYEAYITTEKEWHKLTPQKSPDASAFMSDGKTGCVEFSFLLSGSDPAVTAYLSDTHGGSLEVDTPVVKILLTNKDDSNLYSYDSIREITVKATEIAVNVGMKGAGYSTKGLKQLLISNDGGSLDASKPFFPFGSIPAKDNTLVIGSKEVFSKKNATIKLHVEWANLPSAAKDIKYDSTYPEGEYDTDEHEYVYPAKVDTDNTPPCQLSFLEGGTWKSKSQKDIFSGNSSQVVILDPGESIPGDAATGYDDDYTDYNTASSSGFLRLKLKSDFGHKKYLSDQTLFLLEKNYSSYQKKTVPYQPVEPYTPKIQSVYLSYSACSGPVSLESADDFEGRLNRFFHFYPFGETEQHAFYLEEKGISDIFLVPQFTHKDNEGKRIDHIGELYIGLENLEAQQAVNILFQVLDGSTDPLQSKPEEHVIWSYLSSDRWQEFEENQVSDGTGQLIKSGIISFTIPDDATTDNIMLPSGYLWLRAAIAEAPGAVCKLITVDAQAFRVVFQPNDNADDFLDTALPAGTISKLKEPVSSIKKVTQPYSSFDGRPKENDAHYYLRVSERLRHKARAITIWDYEHLVLEAFPQIHKAKCLNHTMVKDDPDSSKRIYNESLPGNVTIITIPDLKNRNDADPLKPYTSAGTREEIKEFLEDRISCHVNLMVENPQFEEVKIEFELQLAEGYEDFTYYSELLKEEVTEFLTPWAFGQSTDIEFGGKIYKSTLINFIEERSYVDFITNVKMFHTIDETTPGSNDMEEISASTARSILVSVPASAHIVTKYVPVVSEEQEECVKPK